MRMKSIFLSSVLLLSLALLLLTAAEESEIEDAGVVNLAAGGDAGSDRTVFTIPDTVTVLTAENFDGHVFNKEKQRAWIIFVYTPYCTHCRNMMPQFLNASKTVEEHLKLEGCRFALVNAAGGGKLIERFDVTSYPTILYTTGKDEIGHKYQGGHTMASFVHFAEYLYRALQTGSFATDVTDPAAFAAAEKDSGDLRVPFYVFVPASSSPDEEKNEAGWNVAVDGAASMGNSRFAVIHERALPEGWEESASASYKTVVRAARRCQKNGRATGPGGEVLVTVSDRLAAPLCYRGPWLTAEAGAPGTIHPLLQLHVAVYGFHVLEEVNVPYFALLEAQKKSYMGFIITDGPVLSAKDTNYLPVLRAMDQAATTKLLDQADLSLEDELEAPRVVWTYVDGRSSSIWRARYNVEMRDLPAFLIVDAKRDRMFRLRKHVPRFEQIKNDVPWKVGGEQQRLLEKFVEEVLADKYYGEKTSLVGRMSEHLSHYKTLERVYALLKYDDFTFIVVIFAGCFFMFLMFIGCVAEPIMEHYEEKKKRQEELAKKKAEGEKKKKE